MLLHINGKEVPVRLVIVLQKPAILKQQKNFWMKWRKNLK